MPKLPNSSLTVYDLQRFVAADLRRQEGSPSRFDSWDVDSSQYGIAYYNLQISQDDLWTLTRALGSLGRYLIEVRAFHSSESALKGRSAISGPFFRYIVHTPLGTLHWESEEEAIQGGRKGFSACERAAVAALSLVDVVDMFTEESGVLGGAPYRP